MRAGMDKKSRPPCDFHQAEKRHLRATGAKNTATAAVL
jgi:hypothetical protein